ncbi:hypothetical protein NLJ89_g6528 [Agrocybe chaxingu]|uniref:Uncharacterized protein n=1 Tax=Agrocybe chaxingu TaxID=84603 RepID=A0A9W8JWA7_9AGAR|nr:hypothetical protein NLJ89_g6528 [Agrocybe chaxingu]
MSIHLPLTPSASGEVFESTYDANETQRVVSTIPLPDLYPFRVLWREHLAALTAPEPFDTVIDVFIALAEGSANWRAAADAGTTVRKRRETRSLICEHPPNVVVVDGMGDAYAYHSRQLALWPLICISKTDTGLWMTADEGSEKELALAAVLRISFDHEIAH